MPHSTKNELGIALTEFSVVAVILLVLLLGVADFSYLFIRHGDIAAVVREIGREASVIETGTCDEVYEEARTRIEDTLHNMGFASAVVGGGIVEDPTDALSGIDLTGITFMNFLVNLEVQTITNAISNLNEKTRSPHIKTYSFPIERAGGC